MAEQSALDHVLAIRHGTQDNAFDGGAGCEVSADPGIAGGFAHPARQTHRYWQADIAVAEIAIATLSEEPSCLAAGAKISGPRNAIGLELQRSPTATQFHKRPAVYQANDRLGKAQTPPHQGDKQ